MTTKVEYAMPKGGFPHGWKTCVANVLSIHPNTVKNNLQQGCGEMYELIMKTALEKYGTPIKTKTV